MKYLLVVLTLAATCAVLPAQQMPSFSTPPGTKATVQSVSKSYNFYPLTRNILLPWNRLQLPAQDVPAGNSLISSLLTVSPKSQNFYDNPSKYVSGFGSPAKRTHQAFKGKDGEGMIYYLEFTNKTPGNSVALLSKYFFGKNDPPNPNESKFREQFLVNEHTVIIWAFANTKSKVKEVHQEMIFNLISEMATKK
jgi:hypothetical protein